jgi:hypothetical protein
MKKTTKLSLLVLITFMTFLLGQTMQSQTFVKHYNKVIGKNTTTNEYSSWADTNLTAIFSGNDKGDIILYYSDNNVERFIKSGKITSGVNKQGLKFRYIETHNETGDKVTLQLFDNDIFRVLYTDYIIEYQNIKE